MKPRADFKLQTRLAEDSSGCLFDQRARDFLGTGQGSSALEAIFAVRAAARYLHVLQERWAEGKGLSEGRLQLLIGLSHHGNDGLSLGRLADLLGVSPRNITGLVDNLEKAGLVERVPDVADRRSIEARLTSTGRELINSIRQPAMKLVLPLAAGFSQEELVQLRHLSLKLVANAQRLED